MDSITTQYIEEVAAELARGETNKALRAALVLPPVAWDALCAKLTTEQKGKLSDALTSLAVQAARQGAYVEQRHGSGCGDQGHADAVKRQNVVAGRVRKALGYTQARSDINF